MTATAEQLLDAAAAELRALDEIENAEVLPLLLDWDAMTAAEQRFAPLSAPQTPIIWQPARLRLARGGWHRARDDPAALTY